MSNICDDLRAAILQAAMQGRLTKREASDDSIEELRERIIKERSVFKLNKYVKNDSNEASIPDEWRTLKSGEVFELLTGERVSNGEDLPLLDAKYFRGKQFSKTNKGNLANKGDVLILVDGENSGETFLCNEPGYMGSTFKGLFIPNCINRDFALYFLEMNRKILRDNKRGAAIPHLDKKIFFNFAFPIPSLAEQKRIVEKVDELMARVADLEQSADALAMLKKAFPDDIKASLLQYAMQGKLTKQLPEDGNAEDLLEQIKAEKERLVAEGKIKKQKPLAPITDDEVPFTIPENWKWARLGEVCTVFGRIGFRGYTRQDLVEEGKGAITLSPSNVKNGKMDYGKCAYVSWAKYNESPEIMVKNGDILVVKTGSSYGKSAVVEQLPLEATINPQYVVLKFIGCNNYFLQAAISSEKCQQQFEKFVIGTSIPTFSQENLNSTLIPIPPLAEQKRIVERLDVLIKIVESIEGAI